jgi:hypothetical protein
MVRRPLCIALVWSVASLSAARAEPPLLAKAFEQWTAGGGNDLAFTQHTRVFSNDGKVKEERLERYDPSLPDHERWRLIEVDGRPATQEEREKWESRKNRKPRKKPLKSPSNYLDIEQVRLVDESPTSARFEIPVRPEIARLVTLENISILLTVDKQSGCIAGIAATLRQPVRVLLGLARITDLDVDVRLDPSVEASSGKAGDVQTGSTARATMSKLGNAMEFTWTDLVRVTTYGTTKDSE